MQQFHERGSLAESHECHERVVALSDGVFAIIMTIMVLELRVPTQADAAGLKHWLVTTAASQLMVYGASFVLTGFYWMGHRRLFKLVRRVDDVLLWLNTGFLMIAALIPFGATLVGHHPTIPLAQQCYEALFFSLALWALAMFRYVSGRKNLLVRPMPLGVRRQATLVLAGAPALFLGAVVLTPEFPRLTAGLSVLLPLIFSLLVQGPAAQLARDEREDDGVCADTVSDSTEAGPGFRTDGTGSARQ